MNELLIKPVIKCGPATGNDRNSVDFSRVRLVSHDYGQCREKRQLKTIFAFHSLQDALYPFLMQSCLKEDHVKCRELPQCVLGNSLWSLNKLLVANSALISVVFITVVSVMCRVLCVFSTERELNWQLYIWVMLDKNLSGVTM